MFMSARFSTFCFYTLLIFAHHINTKIRSNKYNKTTTTILTHVNRHFKLLPPSFLFQLIFAFNIVLGEKLLWIDFIQISLLGFFNLSFYILLKVVITSLHLIESVRKYLRLIRFNAVFIALQFVQPEEETIGITMEHSKPVYFLGRFSFYYKKIS